jgi:hypothetical protein
VFRLSRRPHGSHLVLATSNLALPMANWDILATNQFGPGENFSFTNLLCLDAPQTYYRLR